MAYKEYKILIYIMSYNFFLNYKIYKEWQGLNLIKFIADYKHFNSFKILLLNVCTI